MLYCNKCNKSYQDENKFCLYCGTPLVVMPNNSDGKANSQQQLNQQFNNPMPQSHSPGYAEPVKKSKSNAPAVIGMFLLDLVPVLGFPGAFIWAWTKFKSKKFILTAFTVIFIIINAAATVFGYAGTINLMKNSLVKAAERQSSSVNINERTGSNTSAQTGTTSDDKTATGFSIPGFDISGYDIPEEGTDPDDNGMMDSGILDSIIPGFSPFGPGTASPGSFDPGSVSPGFFGEGEYQIPEGYSMPTFDEEGNMYIDTDGDGVTNIIVNKDGSFTYPGSETPSQDDTSGTLPNVEEYIEKYGYEFIDVDNNGVYDFICVPGGIVFSYPDSKLDDNGNIYSDRNSDGAYDSYYVEKEGILYIDIDGNGVYESYTDRDGNMYHDPDGDGVYEKYEQEWGQG